MIVGVGIDLCPISRVQRALARHHGRFERRLFTAAERSDCQGRGRPAQHYAARFAAKEALLKALGVPAGLSWHEIEIVSEPSGAPRLLLRGAAAQAAARLGVRRLHLSLSHSDDTAAATVIAEGAEPPDGGRERQRA